MKKIIRIRDEKPRVRKTKISEPELWGLLRQTAAYMLFLAGESKESVCKLLNCTIDELLGQFPNPPSVADKSNYDLLEIKQLFPGGMMDYLELMKDVYNPNEVCRLYLRHAGTYRSVADQPQLHDYFRRKAHAYLGIK